MKYENIDKIIHSVRSLNTEKWQYNINSQDQEFIKTTINGDTIKAHLPIFAHLKPKELGILLYVLTNVRLIKIEISGNEKINSVSYFLNTITTVDRKLVDKDKISINIIFQNTSVGLTYPSNNKEITAFFQTIEEFTAGKFSSNG